LLDLGLALFGSASEAVDDFTTVGQLMGTLDYMAPEQADNSHDVGATADVYSLGATLFKLLTGTAPFETAEYKSPLRKMKALATVEAPKVRSREQNVPEGVAAIIDQMLLTDPAQRLQTAESVADAIAPFVDGHDLKSITTQGMQQANEAKQASEEAIALQLSEKPPSVGDRSPSIPPVAASGGSAKPPGRTRSGMWWAAWGLPLAVILGAVFWLVTDTGTLRIECVEDNVPITIRQGEDVVQELTLKTGENIVHLRSGRHEVIIPVQFENLTVEGANIDIQRGGVSVVKISSSETPASAPVANQSGTSDHAHKLKVPEAASPQPLFDGRTFDQWREVSQIERSPAQLEKAVEALATLGENSRDAEAAEVVLEIASRYPCDPNPPTPEGKLTVAVIRSLRRLNPDATVPVFTKTLSKPACSLHELIVGWLCLDWSEFGRAKEVVLIGSPNLLLAALNSSKEFRVEVAEHWGKIATGPGHATNNAYRVLTRNWENKKPEAFVMQRLGKIVEGELEFASAHDDSYSGNGRLARDAASILATYDPEAKLADCFPANCLTLTSGLFATGNTYVAEPRIDLALLGNSSSWKTLSLLYRKKTVSVPTELPKIKEVLARDESIFNVVIPFQEKDGEKEIGVGYLVNSRILAIDLLGQLGHDSPEVRAILAKEFLDLLKTSPTDDGEFALSSAWSFSLTESADNSPAASPVTHGSGGFGSGHEPLNAVVHEKSVLLNTTLLAWEKITGSPAKFANSSALRSFTRASAGHVARPPILVAYQGKTFSELADLSTLDFDTPDDIQERLLILADDLADPQSKRQNRKAIQEIEARILTGQSYGEQHVQLMQSVLSGTEFTEQHDAALAKALQQATPEQRDILLGTVIADRSLLEISHLNPMVAGPVKSPTPTHLSANRSRYPRHPSPKTNAEFAKLLSDFEELPAAQQAALLTIVDAIINPLPFSGNDLPAKAGGVHPLEHAAVECLTKICRQENDTNKLEAALILAPRIKLRRADQTLVQDILMKAASSRSPRLDCINAIVRLPAAFNGEFTEAAALTIADLIVSDFEKDFEEEFTVIVPSTIDLRFGGGNRSVPLPLSRRTLLADALASAVPKARRSREKIALKLSPAIAVGTLREVEFLFSSDDQTFFEALSKYRVVDLEVNNPMSATVAQQMLSRLMQSLLGDQWEIALNKLKDE